jgi:hypothetical protein
MHIEDPDSGERVDFWWDDEAGQYVEGTRTGPIPREQKMEYDGTRAVKKLLEDAGTRFEHLADFQDFLSDGLVAVENSLSRYKNDADIERQKNLAAALTLLKAYQYNLAQYDRKKFDFNTMLDLPECTASKEVLNEIKSDRKKAAEHTTVIKVSETPDAPPDLDGPPPPDTAPQD